MSEELTTPYSNQCNILGEIWISLRDDADFEEFIDYNDMGLPLAYMISEGIVESTPTAQKFITETWALLLEYVEKEDTGFESLDDLF